MNRLASIAFAALAASLPLGADALGKDANPPETASAWSYKAGEVECDGVVAWPKGEGKHPAVLVIHDWMGMSPFLTAKVEQLSTMGYASFGADIYGRGVRPANGKEAGAQAGRYKTDRALFRARVRAAFDALVLHPLVDPKRVVVIGYCFGGTGALELARGGADVAGVVSFHGGLSTPTPEDAKAIRGKVLVLHGAEDPYVPPAEIVGFEKEMRDAKVDWQLVKYGGAVHAFTNPAAGDDPSKGAAYHAVADRRSWDGAKAFFDEVLVAR